MAYPVLLVSGDPMLGSALRTVHDGHVRVVPFEPGDEVTGWRWPEGYAVVLDVALAHRAAALAWIRRHHHGRLVIVLRPGEPTTGLPASPEVRTLRRPFLIRELAAALAGEPPADPEPRPSRAPVPGSPDPPRSSGAPVPGSPDPSSAAPGLLDAGAHRRPRRPLSPSGTSAARGRVPQRPAAPAPAAPDRRPERPGPAGARPQPPRHRPQLPRGPHGEHWPKPRSQRRRARLLLVAGLAALGALVLVTGWLLAGLLDGRRDLGAAAAQVRADLVRADTAMHRHDPSAARAALGDAATNLDRGEAVLGRRPLRLAAHLPMVSPTVADARHLLAAARRLTVAGGHAAVLSEQLQSDRSSLLRRGFVNLRAVAALRAQAGSLLAELDAALAELRAVRGGPLDPGIGDDRRWAMDELGRLDGQVRPLLPVLDTLPRALGAGRPRTWLVVLTTLAELRPSGGVPLAVVAATVEDGALRVGSGGALTEDVHDVRVTWKAVRGDPWAGGPTFDDFSLANSSPDFPTAGQELVRAYRARSGRAVDGVVTVDPMGMQALLQATGPMTVPGYGRLTAATCVKATNHDAYVRWPDRQVRRGYNELLVGALLTRLVEGDRLRSTGTALAAAGARRHLQLYAADPAVQQLLAGHGLAGTLAPASQDYLAVYTLNANRSRVDYFQRRDVRQVARLARDGSATVRRTITVRNAVPPSEPLRPDRLGYFTSRNLSTLATYLPERATLTGVELDGRAVRPQQARERGRPFLRIPLDLAPGQSATVTVRYRVAGAAIREGGGLRYELVTDPQQLVAAPALRVEVLVPQGMRAAPAAGWAVHGGTATAAGPFDDRAVLRLDLRQD
ncbi:MAG TPA: DUF4012 domain-containing protein [Actinomycetes bacterium]|nr:DUF4012 domain-containing protein [Actinomycetes bacterium]